MDVLETVFLDERLLHDGLKWVEVGQRVDGLGDEERKNADVRLRKRRRGTLCVILRRLVVARIYDEAIRGGGSASKREDGQPR